MSILTLRNRLSLTIFFASLLGCLTGGLSLYAQVHEYAYIKVTSDTVKQLPAFTDKEFYGQSTGVLFKVGKTDINPQDPFLEQYRNEIVPMINQGHLQLRKIFIRGAASPEGSYALNQRLGKGRTNALLTELQKELRHQYLKAEVDLSSVTEDYGYLCILMEEANDADFQTVRKIYDDCKGNEQACKKRLMAVNGGKLWARMLKQYFPQLRSARMMMWFSEPDQEHAPISLAIGGVQLPHRSIEGPELIQQDVCLSVPEPQEAGPRRHLIAVRTNLLHDFMYMPQFGWAMSPNVQLEYYPLKGHYTYNIGMTWGTHRHWDTQEFFQVRDFQFELRRYFKGGGEFKGAYLGAYLHGNKYGIGLSKSKGWEGEGGGGGLSVGYVMPLNRKGYWRLEFMAAVGYYLTRYDPYVYGNPISGKEDGDYYYDYLGSASDFKKRNHQFTWFGPTNVGIQVTYDIIYRKRHKVQKGGRQ